MSGDTAISLRRGWASGALCVVLFLTAMFGCASQPTPPERRAISHARAGLQGAVESGQGAIEASAPFRLRARYNPSRCHPEHDCSPYEVHYSGSWHRVFLVSSDAAGSRLEALSPMIERRTPLMFLGVPTDRTQRSETTGQLHSVFELEEVEVGTTP